MFPIGVGIGVISYAVFYYGYLRVKGFPAVVSWATDSAGNNAIHGPIIKFTDVLMPSHLSVLQTYLAAGPAQATTSGGSS